MDKLTDKEILEQNAHISTETIRQDIKDTEDEITRLKQGKGPGLYNTGRLESGREKAIDQRRDFVEFLHKLLKLRGEE